MYCLYIVYSLHILHIVHNLYIHCVVHTVTLAFHAKLAKYLHLVQAEQLQSKTQLNSCRHQRDGHQRRHQREFRDIFKLNINCIFA